MTETSTSDRDGRRSVAARIRARARELGFDQVGFAPAEKPLHAEWYREWLERGWHGELGYLSREDAVRRRVSLDDALPGCRSIIVVSLSYATPEDGPTDDPLAPVVARYARGADYHGVFEEKLAALGETIEEIVPGERVLPYVDYGPVLERDHAQRAGLGWIGKNTVLIDPELGSYLLLGELLTTLELPPDEPFTADRCGSCSRCIEACPTDAIRGPRELDARRCISYLTIELKGSIPRELRSAIGNRIFGCDICQEVCPWNRAAPPSGHEAFRPGKPVAFGSMIDWAAELLATGPGEFRDRYRGTALERPGREGLLRNLCVGLGNSGSHDAVPVLERCLEDRGPLVRGHAAWALGEIGGQAASEALSGRRELEEDDRVRKELELALSGSR